MSEGARKRGCKWKNNQKRCIVDKNAGGGGSDSFTESTSTSAFAGASCAAQDQQIVALNANITNLNAEVAGAEAIITMTSAAALADALAGKTAAEATIITMGAELETSAAALAAALAGKTAAEATIVAKDAELETSAAALAEATAGEAAAEAANDIAAVSLAAAIEAKETCEADKSMARMLDFVGEMVWNHTTKVQVAPIGTTTLGHGLGRRLRDGGNPGVLDLEPANLNQFERLGIVLPFDWECQAGTSGGVYPCPNGIPSTCRGVSSVCAKCYCELGSHTCCPYYDDFSCPSALLSGDALVTDSAVNYCEVGDMVSAVWELDGESYSANVTEVTDSTITVTYTDGDTSTYGLMESGKVVQTASGADCVTTCDSATLDKEEVWGSQWWEDPTVTTSFINFKVTRYELASEFGVEFYSTEGDTLKVFPTGDVHFKPANAARTIYINEQVEYDYDTDQERRLSLAEDVFGDIDLTKPISDARLMEARARYRSIKKNAAAASEESESVERRLQFAGAFGGSLLTTGSFTMMAASGGF